jgi:hypothetical protein
MFGISPLAQLGGYWYWTGKYSNETIINAYIIIFVGLIVYEISYHSKNNINIRNTKFDPKQALTFAIVILMTAFIAVIYLFRYLDFFSYHNVFVQGILDQYGTIGYAFILLFIRNLPLCALLLLIVEIKSYNLKNKYTAHILIILLAIFLLLTSNPTITSRWWLSTVIISLSIAIWGNKAIFKTLIGIGFPIAYIIVFPILDFFRYEKSFVRYLYPSSNWLANNLSNGDFDSFQQILNTLIYVKHSGLTYGYQLLGIFTFWIPRSSWYNKPLDTGILVGNSLDYGFTNLSSPLWAEGYVNFGIIGVIIFLSTFGFFSHFLDDSFNSYLNSSNSFHKNNNIIVVCLFMIPAQTMLLRGSLQVSVQYIFPGILILFGFSLLYRAINR